MTSPFKLLDAYTAADRDQFFGREEEEAALYDMVAKNRLILIYGQSGTGKTSLVQCGLAAHFDVTDWYPLNIRRQVDLNDTLYRRLVQASGVAAGQAVVAMLDMLYATYLRPAYLIFDQLEELFILGTVAEQEAFAETIRSILQSTVPCRLLFVIREEYLACLYAFERTVPTLFDRRLR
ncbi:MAG: ATP-binding protein, partial [Saprospiraceae bacterium]